MAAPSVPPAPLRLSTTIDWPSARPTCAASGRAKASFTPPAANGTIQVTALAGHASAHPGPATPAIASPPSAARLPNCIAPSPASHGQSYRLAAHRGPANLAVRESTTKNEDKAVETQ